MANPWDTPPNNDQIFQYRFNYGVNLGSLFVLESWIYNDLFDKGGAAEFDAVRNQINSSNVNVAGQKLAQHYNSYINSIDWNYLANVAGTTAIRVPIGYWHVNNANFTSITPFNQIRGAYQVARPWDILKSLIDKANSYNIGVLIDVHGLPGGANGDAHSGIINNPPTFFANGGYKDLMVNTILPYIVNDVCKPKRNVIGLQIVNEASFDGNGSSQKDYYSRAIRKIGSLHSTLPVVISDGWWADQFADWAKQQNFTSTVVIDTHIYRCYSAEDKSKTAQQITSELNTSVYLPNQKADFLVGEFSCVLDEDTWRKTSGDRNALIKQYGLEQCKQFANKSSWGWFFWTLKFQWGDGGEWSYLTQLKKNNIYFRISDRNTTNIDNNRIEAIIRDHINYWKDKGGDKMQHWRYIDGIYKAAYDTQAFGNFKNSRIGRQLSWTKLRRAQYVSLKGDSEYMWEWDQGYARGLQEYNHY